MTNQTQVQQLTDMDHCPAHCGVIVATVAAKAGSIVNEDGIIRVTANAQGNSSYWFPIEVSATDTAGAQLVALDKAAASKGHKGFRCQITGPVEMDYAPSVLEGSPERQLKLHCAATTVRPVHPDAAKDPYTNTLFAFGQVSDKGWEMEFVHLDSALEDDKSPLKMKLTKQAQDDLAHLRGKNVSVIGTLSRQQNLDASEVNGKTLNPYDHVSLSVSSAQACVSFAGKPRNNWSGGTKKPAVVSNYEDGFDDVDATKVAAAFDGLDF